MTGSTWLYYFQAASYLAAAISAFRATITYARNSRQERARWLFELYEKFYESASHVRMQRLLESGETRFAETEEPAEAA